MSNYHCDNLKLKKKQNPLNDAAVERGDALFVLMSAIGTLIIIQLAVYLSGILPTESE